MEQKVEQKVEQKWATEGVMTRKIGPLRNIRK